jgi:hypothetical protein
MSQQVEINLRIPNMKVRTLDASGYPVDHSAIRFRKVVEVPTIPKPGEILRVSASDRMLEATVVRADWNEDRGMFVVACQYSTRSITTEDHAALVADPQWTMTPLI